MENHTDEAARLRREAGAYIQRLRLDRNLTQLELAIEVGVGYYTVVSQVETGQASVPSYQLKRWAQALGVDRRLFARKLLKCYNPYMSMELFGKHGKT